MTSDEIQRALLAYQGQPQGMQTIPMQAPELTQVDQAMQTLDMRTPPQPPAPTPAAPVNPYQQLGQAITESSNAQQQALEAQQQAIAQASIDRDIATEGRAMELEQEAAENRQRQQAYQAEQSARMKEAQAFLKQADQPIADRRTIGNKVAGAIAIALSGMGDAIAAKGGNRNTGHMQRTMSLIDEQVNRDIMIQRENLANKRNAAGAKFTEMGIAQGMFADQERAAQFAASLRKEAYADEMLKLAKNVEDAEKSSVLTQQGIAYKQNAEAQRFQLAQAELEDKRRRAAAAAQQQARQASARRAAEAAKLTDVKALMDLGTPEAMERAGKLAALEKDLANADKERAAAAKERGEAGGPVAPPGFAVADSARWSSLGETSKRELDKKAVATKRLEAELAKMDALLAQHGTESWGEASAELATRRAAVMGLFKDKDSLGTLDAGLIQYMDNLLGDPTAWSERGSIVRKKLQTAKEMARDDIAESAYNAGLRIPDARESFTAAPAPSAPAPAPNAPAAPQMVPMLNRRGALEMVHPDMVQTALGLKYQLASDYDPILNRKKAEAAAKAASAPDPAPAMPPTPNVADMTNEEYARYVTSDRGDL